MYAEDQIIGVGIVYAQVLLRLLESHRFGSWLRHFTIRERHVDSLMAE